MTTGLFSPLMQRPIEELRQRSRIRFRLTRDIPSHIEDFAQLKDEATAKPIEVRL